jgi:hypothetical protein
MAHPFDKEAMTGQERAKARYSAETGKRDQDPQKPEESWIGAPARQVSNTGNVRK